MRLGSARARRPTQALGLERTLEWAASKQTWQAVKHVASEAILRGGGTITHHHAVGRDHRRWYDRQRPDPFAAALRAARAAVDPAGILNPGVLV